MAFRSAGENCAASREGVEGRLEERREALFGPRHDLDEDLAAVFGIADPADQTDLLQAVDDARHSAGRQARQLGDPAGESTVRPIG